MSNLQWRNWGANAHRAECGGSFIATITLRPDGKYNAIVWRDITVMAAATVATIDEGKLWCEAYFVQECADQLEEESR
jgi:hypothetical protein